MWKPADRAVGSPSTIVGSELAERQPAVDREDVKADCVSDYRNAGPADKRIPSIDGPADADADALAIDELAPAPSAEPPEIVPPPAIANDPSSSSSDPVEEDGRDDGAAPPAVAADDSLYASAFATAPLVPAADGEDTGNPAAGAESVADTAPTADLEPGANDGNHAADVAVPGDQAGDGQAAVVDADEDRRPPSPDPATADEMFRDDGAAADSPDADGLAELSDGPAFGMDDEVAEPEDAATPPGKAPVYRPRLQRLRTRRPASAPAAASGAFRDLEADLHLVFGAGDWGVEIGALLRLPEGGGDVAVLDGGEETWLGPLDDRLLEPLLLANGARALEEGLSITAVGMPVRWRRSTRDLHVLGESATVAGFASRPRVMIGQENVVVCRDGLAPAALAQIRATGSAEPAAVEGPGVPDGWTLWRGVRPLRPSPPVSGPEILHALDPFPNVSIEIAGGLLIGRGTWLTGHPPAIRLLGLVESGEPVLIDGRAAEPGPDGGWTAEGWDACGAHRVEHGGLTAGYEIGPGMGGAGWWPAWGAATGLAGALASADGATWFYGGPAAQLLGARPGELCHFAQVASGVHAARPDFAPVWMITSEGGLRRVRAALVGTPLEPASAPAAPAASAGPLRWARSIASARPAAAAGTAERRLWDRYAAAARGVRRRAR